MTKPEEYAKYIEQYAPKFVECKGYVAVGGAKMKQNAVPNHQEVLAFAQEIQKHCAYKIINQKEDSRVVQLGRE